MNTRKKIVLLAANAVIAVSVTILTVRGCLSGAGSGQVGSGMVGIGYFKPYTVDSNVLAGAAAVLLLIKNRKLPKWAAVLYLMAACCLTLTMLLTAGFLAPMRAMRGGSYFSMFSGDMFFFHLLNPLLAILTFTCLMKEHTFSRRDCVVAMIPTVAYSAVYFLMVVVLKRWEDFYNFTFGGRYALIPAVVAVIYSGVYLIARVLTRFHNGRPE